VAIFEVFVLQCELCFHASSTRVAGNSFVAGGSKTSYHHHLQLPSVVINLVNQSKEFVLNNLRDS